jgi:hypothetical protein
LADNRSGYNTPVSDFNQHLEGEHISNGIESIDNSVHNLSLKDNRVGGVKQLSSITDSEGFTNSKAKEKSPRRNTPRPVANATVFVQEDPRNDKGSIFDTAVKTEEPDAETQKPNDSEQLEETGFLPKILVTKTDEVENSVTPTSNRKQVTFDDGDVDMRDRADSDCSKITTDSDSQPRGKRRRNSLATASLKLLVDSHHGAAKLRYIARLATEMEKEELGKHTPEPEPDIYKEIQDCRYLRVVERKGSAHSRDG